MKLYEYNGETLRAEFFSRFDETLSFALDGISAAQARNINDTLREMERVAYHKGVSFLMSEIDKAASSMRFHLSSYL